MPFSQLHILLYEFQEKGKKKKKVGYVAVVDFVILNEE